MTFRSTLRACASPTIFHGWASGVAVVDQFIFVSGGYDRGSTFDAVERYDTTLNQWETMKPMTISRADFGCVAHESYIYAIGGSGKAYKIIDSDERYDTSKNAWEKIAPMPTRRIGLGSAVMNGLIYAVGGEDEEGTRFNSVEVYDPVKNT